MTKLRSYLIGINKWYAVRYGYSYSEGATLPSLVLGMTIGNFFIVFDTIWSSGMICSELVKWSDFGLGIPIGIPTLIIYFFYKKRLPSEMEVRQAKENWFGIIISILSLAGFTACVIYLKETSVL